MTSLLWRIVATKQKKIQNNLKVLLNVLQHDVENDENLTDDDYDLVSENKSESDN